MITQARRVRQADEVVEVSAYEGRRGGGRVEPLGRESFHLLELVSHAALQCLGYALVLGALGLAAVDVADVLGKAEKKPVLDLV